MGKRTRANLRIIDRELNSFLSNYMDVLNDCGFRVKDIHIDGSTLIYKALLGYKSGLLFDGILPWKIWLDKTKRVGVNSKLKERGNDLSLEIELVSYRETEDKPEIFMLTQGPIEKLTDEKFCRKKLDEILDKLKKKKIEFTKSQS